MTNPMKKVPQSRVAEEATVEPFRREEIELLIKACDACAEADTHDWHRFTMARLTGKRKAILLTAGHRPAGERVVRPANRGCEHEDRQGYDPAECGWQGQRQKRAGDCKYVESIDNHC